VAKRPKSKDRKRGPRKPAPAAAVLDQLQPTSDSLTNLSIRRRREEETVGGRGRTLRDNFGLELLKLKGTVDPNIDLEF
jgi:hypothetical protein